MFVHLFNVCFKLFFCGLFGRVGLKQRYSMTLHGYNMVFELVFDGFFMVSVDLREV